MGKQAVESVGLNLMLLNFRIINWAGLSHYGINFEQQTILCKIPNVTYMSRSLYPLVAGCYM